MKYKFIAILSVLALAACSSKPMNLQEKNDAFRQYISTNNIEDVNKVTSFRFNGWSSLTDEFMLLSSSPRKNYLIELTGFCDDIRWANTIKLNRSSDSSLHARFDSVSTLKNPQLNCRINKIYPITKDQKTAIREIYKPSKEKSDD